MLNSEGTNFLIVLNLLEDPMDSTGIFFFFLEGQPLDTLSYFSVRFGGEGTGRNAFHPLFPDTQCPSLQL